MQDRSLKNAFFRWRLYHLPVDTSILLNTYYFFSPARPRASRSLFRRLFLDRCSRRGSTSSIHGVVRCSTFRRPCRSPDATLGNRSVRCSNSCIRAIVPPPSDLHGWPLSHILVALRHLHVQVQCRKCKRIVGTILALESYTPSLRQPVRNAS